MRRLLFISVLLLSAACSRNRAITSQVASNMPAPDARTCTARQLETLGYTIVENKNSTGAVEGVRAAVPSDGVSDRIDVVIQPNRPDMVNVGSPDNAMTITVHTLNAGGHDVPPSARVKADGASVSATCSRQ